MCSGYFSLVRITNLFYCAKLRVFTYIYNRFVHFHLDQRSCTQKAMIKLLLI